MFGMQNRILPLMLALLFTVPSSTLAMGVPVTPPTIQELQQKVSAELDSMDRDLALAAQRLAGSGLQGEDAAAVLHKLYEDHPCVVDAATVDPEGRLLLIRPLKYSASEGKSIADQAHFLRLKNSGKPVMSDLFKTVEGFYAVSIGRPVLSQEGEPIGYISLVFQPDALVRNIIMPLDNSAFKLEALAIQTNGRVVYDKDFMQVGKMTFTDPAYQLYPSLLSLARSAVQEESGSGVYEYPASPGGEPVKKEAQWATVGLHGTEWRLILSKYVTQ